MEFLVAIPPLLFGAAAFAVGRCAPVVGAALVVWGALLVALFASGGGDFGPWLAVGPWFALTTVSIAGAVFGAWLGRLRRRGRARRDRDGCFESGGRR